MRTYGIAVLAANQAKPPQSSKMMTKCLFFFFFALVAACSAGYAPVAVPAALTVGTYQSTVHGHEINHAYAAPYVAHYAAQPAYAAYSALPAYTAYSAPIIAGRR